MRAAIVLLLLASSAPVRADLSDATGTPRVEVGTPAHVIVWNREVVTVRARVGDLDPAERAARIRRRIEELPAGTAQVTILPIDIASIRLMLLSAGGHQIVGLYSQDLDPDSGDTLEGYADATAARLRDVLRARAEQHRVPAVIRAVVVSLGATAMLALALALAFRVHGRALRRPKPVHPHLLLGVDAAYVVTVLRRVTLRITLVAFVAVATYAWLGFVLVQFPYTRPWGAQVGSYLRTLLGNLGTGALDALPGLFAVLVIFLVTRFIAATVDGLFRGVEEGRLEVAWLDSDTARATRRIVSAVIWVFAITVAYPYIPGSETGVFKGISVFVGLVLTLGSSGLVNQVMSGILLVYARAFRPGDYVKVGEALEGTVTQVGLLSTKLHTYRHEEVTVPNAVLVGSSVRNLSRLAGEHGAIASTTLTIGYDAPWRQVHALLLRAAAETHGVRGEPQPYVLQRALSDFFVEYELLVHLEEPRARPFVLSALHARIQDAFNEAGVQIMSPHFEGQPEEKVLVPRARWHAPQGEEREGDAGAEASGTGRH